MMDYKKAWEELKLSLEGPDMMPYYQQKGDKYRQGISYAYRYILKKMEEIEKGAEN